MKVPSGRGAWNAQESPVREHGASRMLTLTLPENSPPVGLLPALYSVWVTADALGQPDQVFCGLREYGMVCVFSAESLGLR